jgi:hypothetical protein
MREMILEMQISRGGAGKRLLKLFNEIENLRFSSSNRLDERKIQLSCDYLKQYLFFLTGLYFERRDDLCKAH